jgi:hypothetical protein
MSKHRKHRPKKALNRPTKKDRRKSKRSKRAVTVLSAELAFLFQDDEEKTKCV